MSGSGRISKTGAGGNKGAGGGALRLNPPLSGSGRVEPRAHVLARLRSPRLNAMAIGEGDGRARFRGFGRSGGGVSGTRADRGGVTASANMKGS